MRDGPLPHGRCGRSSRHHLQPSRPETREGPRRATLPSWPGAGRARGRLPQVGDGGGEGFGPAGGGAEKVELEILEREVFLDEAQEAGRAERFLARGEGGARILEDPSGKGGGADEAGAAQNAAPDRSG